MRCEQRCEVKALKAGAKELLLLFSSIDLSIFFLIDQNVGLLLLPDLVIDFKLLDHVVDYCRSLKSNEPEYSICRQQAHREVVVGAAILRTEREIAA